MERLRLEDVGIGNRDDDVGIGRMVKSESTVDVRLGDGNDVKVLISNTSFGEEATVFISS